MSRILINSGFAFVVSLFAVSIFTGCETTNTRQPTGSGLESSRASPISIKEAKALVDEKRYDEAESRFIRPVLMDFESLDYRVKRKLRSASNGVELMYYLIEAASKNNEVTVEGPEVGFAYFLRGYIAVEQEKLKVAETALRSATEVSPGSSSYWSELGHVLQVTNRFEEAKTAFETAIERAPFSGDETEVRKQKDRALRGKGFCLIELDRLEEATIVYNECLKENPNDQVAKSELEYIIRKKWGKTSLKK